MSIESLLSRGRGLTATYDRGSTCDILSVTNTPGGHGGNAISYTTLHSAKACRIENSSRVVTEQPIGGRETGLAHFDIHLSDYSIVVLPSQIIRSGGVDYEVIDDISNLTLRAETIAFCRRLT